MVAAAHAAGQTPDTEAPPSSGYHGAVTEVLNAARRHRLGLFTLAALIALAWVVWSARDALPAFAIGAALAFVLDPPVTWLERARVPRWAGVLLMYAVTIGVIWVLIAFAIPPIAAQTSDFINSLPRLLNSVADVERGIASWYASLPIPADVRTFIDNLIVQGQQQAGSLIQAILVPTFNTLLQTLTFLFGLIVIPAWLFFVLKDRDRLPGAVAGAMPPAWRQDAVYTLEILGRVGGQWVRGELALAATVFILTAIGFGILTLIGFSAFGQFTLTLALIAGILEWLPVVGPMIAGIPAFLVGISISPPAALASILVAVAVQQVENNLLVPKVMGDAVELNPAVLIVSLVVGAALFGLAGAILSVPVSAMVRDLYRYAFRRLAEMPADEAYLLTMSGAPMTRGEEAPPDGVPPPDAGEPTPQD